MPWLRTLLLLHWPLPCAPHNRRACLLCPQLLEILNMKGKHKHKWEYLRQVLLEKIVYDDMVHRAWFTDETMMQGLLFACKQGQANIDKPFGEALQGQGGPSAAVAAEPSLCRGCDWPLLLLWAMCHCFRCDRARWSCMVVQLRSLCVQAMPSRSLACTVHDPARPNSHAYPLHRALSVLAAAGIAQRVVQGTQARLQVITPVEPQAQELMKSWRAMAEEAWSQPGHPGWTLVTEPLVSGTTAIVPAALW